MLNCDATPDSEAIITHPLPYRQPTDLFRHFWLGPTMVFGVVMGLALFGIKFSFAGRWVSTVWAPDAVVLACLLWTPPRRWGLYLFASVAGETIANLSISPIFMRCLSLAVMSNFCPYGAAFLLRRSDQRIDLTQRTDLVRFFIAAGVLGPALSSALTFPYVHYLLVGIDPYHYAGAWFTEHALGCIIVTPALLVLSTSDVRRSFTPEQRKGLLISLSVVTFTAMLTFYLTPYPLLFLIFPALIFATFRGGFVGAALGALITSIIGSTATLSGYGPPMMENDPSSQVLLLQFFLVIVFLTTIPVAATLAEIRQSEAYMIEARQNSAEQNRLLQLAEQIAHVGHWRLNTPTQDFFWSDETYRIHGQSKADYTPTIDNTYQRYHPEDRESVAEAVKRALEVGENRDLVVRIIRPSGEIRYIKAQRIVEYGPDHKSQLIFGVIQDVTDIKLTEQALVKALADAQHANRAKSDFLASMSHELRTPLNAIIGFSELLLRHPKEKLSTLQAEYIGYVLTSGQHLLQLVKDVLDLATIESGRLKVTLEPVQLHGLLKELESVIRYLADEKGLIFEPMDLPPEPLPFVHANHGRLLQVLLNLGSNAIKYNKFGGCVRITVTEIDGGWVRIAISDTGYGIPMDRQTELFEPFNRLGAENGAIEGTGIGLSICKQLIEQMGGTLGFASELGIGSSFWIDVRQHEPAGTKDGSRRLSSETSMSA